MVVVSTDSTGFIAPLPPSPKGRGRHCAKGVLLGYEDEGRGFPTSRQQSTRAIQLGGYLC